jgi:hypothetical protein
MPKIVPDDFFEYTPTHINRIDEDTLNDKYIPEKLMRCSPGWRFTPATDAGKVHFLSCKRRGCERCGKYWAWKWRKMLEDKALSLAREGLPAMRRALTLTTSYDPGYERMRSALNMFWEQLRKIVPGLQYWGVTEYNQEQTQPHFHFILGNDEYIPQPTIKELWEKVQKWAGFESIAWNVYIEEIKDNSDIQRYFTKYLTKLTGGKNEIPDREKWKGRYVRYSKKFFNWSTDIILTALFLQQNISSDSNYNTYYKVRPKLINDYRAQDNFIQKCIQKEQEFSDFINRDWNPDRDKQLAYEQMKPVTGQLTLF